MLYVDRRDRLRGSCRAVTILYGSKPRNPQTARDILEQGGSLTGVAGAAAGAGSRRWPQSP